MFPHAYKRNKEVSFWGEKGSAKWCKDYHRYYLAGRAYNITKNPFNIYNIKYSKKKFKYLPSFAFIMVILSKIPFRFSLLVWLFFNLIGVSITLYLWGKYVFNLFNIDKRFYSLFLIMVLPIIWRNFKLGQLNVLCFWLWSLGLYLLIKRKEIFSSFLLAASAALKFVPFIFVLPFILLKKKKVLIYFILFTLIWIWILPAFIFGLKNNFKLVPLSIKKGTKATIEEKGIKDVIGFSISSVMLRYFSNTTYKRSFSSKKIKINFLNIPINTVKKIAMIINILLIIFSLIIAKKLSKIGKRTSKEFSSFWEAYVISFFVIIFLLISPETRIAHFIHLVIPILFVFSLSFYVNLPYKILFLLSYIILFASLKKVLGIDEDFLLQAIGLKTYGLFLFGILYYKIPSLVENHFKKDNI